MTYDQWFRSQQEIPCEGMFMFAGAAWDQQQQRIDDQAAKIQQMALEYISEQGQWIETASLYAINLAQAKQIKAYQDLCNQIGAFLEFAWRDVPMSNYAFDRLETALAAWREMEGGCYESQ